MKNIILFFFVIYCINISAQNAAHACSSSKIKGYNYLHNHNNRALSDMDKYDVKSLKLELEVNNTSTLISGKSTQLVEVLVANLTQFVFELHEDLNITEVKINNTTALIQRFGNEVIVENGLLYTLNDLVRIEVIYNGLVTSNGETGIFNATSPSWGVQVTWTLSEPFSAHTWWPAKQVLSDKIDSTELIFTCTDNLKVGSNGLLVNEESLANNKKRFTWKSNYPIDYYLVSFAVAPYQDYSFKIVPNGATDSLLIQNFIYDVPNYLNTFEDDILETGEMMFLLSDLYGEYPFINEKYGHSVAPLNGGMEHQTMTTQGFFADWLTVHELGHQWWGNHVTCETWSDIWINEGFASYSEYLYFQNQSQAAADADMDARHLDIKNLPGGSLYVYDITNSNIIFDSRLTYNKGAAVVHMLRNFINDDNLFFETLKKFQNNFGGATCSTTQFNTFFSQETNIDLSEFIDAWVYGEGYPKYSGKFNALNDTIYIQIYQESALSNSNMTYPSNLELLVSFEDGSDTLLNVYNATAVDNYLFPINKIVSNVVVDPNKWLIKSTNPFVKDDELYFEYFVSSLSNQNNIAVNYNNPVTDKLTITVSSAEKLSLSIVDINGSIMTNKEISKTLNLDTKYWPKGIYFLHLKGVKEQFSSKVLKL